MSEQGGSTDPVKILALSGNTELKCVLGLLVEPDETVDVYELFRRFEAAQGFQEVAHIPRYIHYMLARTVGDCLSKAGVFEAPEEVYSLKEWNAYKVPESNIHDSVAGYSLDLAASEGTCPLTPYFRPP